jgi:hypothetical protein
MGGVLASLLPGLRDLRAPVAAGYIWLGIIWLAWGRHQNDLASSRGLAGDIYDLAHAAGPVAIGVALSFTAYILGVLSISLLGGIRERLSILWIGILWGRRRLLRFTLIMKPEDFTKQRYSYAYRAIIRTHAIRLGLSLDKEAFYERKADQLDKDLDPGALPASRQ